MEVQNYNVIVRALSHYNQASVKLAIEIRNILQPAFPDVQIDVGSYPSDKSLECLVELLQNDFEKLNPFLSNSGPVKKLPFWIIFDYKMPLSGLFEARSNLAFRMQVGAISAGDIQDAASRFVHHVTAVRKWLQNKAHEFLPSLNQTEESIVNAVQLKPLTGEKIARALAISYNSNLKKTLASLVDRQILTNKRGIGYQSTIPQNVESCQSQD